VITDDEISCQACGIYFSGERQSNILAWNAHSCAFPGRVQSSGPMSKPVSGITLSVIAVSYNHRPWLEKLFQSFKSQTIYDRCELIVVDNGSTDGTDSVCVDEFRSWNGRGIFLRSGGNIGFGAAHNIGAKVAHGKYLLMHSPDLWFEEDCMERILEAMENSDSKIFTPVELKYNSDEPQSGNNGYGSPGLDIFGCATTFKRGHTLDDLFAFGCLYFMEKDLFFQIGGFDEEFFMYGEEVDLSWRAKIAGAQIQVVKRAKIHHATAGFRDNKAQLNGQRRFYANRNQLVLILKNSDSFLSILAFTYICLIAAEAFAGALIGRCPSFIWWSVIKPVADCFRLRRHIGEERDKVSLYRQLGDYDIFRHYLKFGFGHWVDVKRFFPFKITFKPANQVLETEQIAL
jgi:GT2 family glycosyltransferase